MDWPMLIMASAGLIMAVHALLFMSSVTKQFKKDPEYTASKFMLSKCAMRSMVFFVMFQLTLAVAFILMELPGMNAFYVPISNISVGFLLLSTYSARRALRDDAPKISGMGGVK